MAYEKGERVEPGIWRLKVKDGTLYLVEVNYFDARTRRRYRERKTTHRLDLAREWRQSRKTDALRGEIRRKKDRHGAISFDRYANEYMEKWSAVEKRASTQKREWDVLRVHLKPFMGKKLLSEITRRDVEQYTATRKGEGASPFTVNRELCLIKNMLRKAVDWEYLEASPAAGVRQMRAEAREFHFLSEEEMDRFIEAAPAYLKALFVVALNTGLRRGELFRLAWEDVDFEQGFITVRQTKNYEPRYVPMNALVRQALQGHPRRIVQGKVCPLVFSNEDGTEYQNIDKGFRATLRRAGVTKHFRIHDMRHTFASHLTMKGVDLRTVAKLLGHRDIKQTMRYAHLAPEHLQAAVESLTRRTPQKREQQAG
jgi:site-specific recombinase XerD